ncbi:MAG: hypothetical protein S0880_01910 [Actinomycetota bacterium]|nr:hypothetical protein [Actinomycetota bacterium]
MTYIDDRPAGFPPPPPFEHDALDPSDEPRTEPSLRRRVLTVTGAVTAFAAVAALGAFAFSAAGEASGLRDDLAVQADLLAGAETDRDAAIADLADAEATAAGLTVEIDDLTAEATDREAELATLADDVSDLETSLSAANTRASNSADDAAEWRSAAGLGYLASGSSYQCIDALFDLSEVMLDAVDAGTRLSPDAAAIVERMDLWCGLAVDSIDEFNADYEELIGSI